MKLRHILTTLCFGLSATPVLATDTCAWAGGEYAFSDHGIYGDFTINDDCTQMVWSRLSDGPETTALQRTKDGWKGELEKVDVELLENGRSLRITGDGGVRRQSQAKRKN